MSLEALPADQRAVIQLILQQGRTYAELAELMRSTPEAIRERAHDGLTALAGGRGLPPAVADYLLGQQVESEEAATRDRIAADAETHRTVVLLVRLLAGTFRGSMPQIPLLAATAPPDAAEPTGADEPRASLLGGAILIAVIAALAAAVLIWALDRDDDDDGRDRTPAAAATATPSATAAVDAAGQPQLIAQLRLSAPLGGEAQGGMAVFQDPSKPDELVFQVAGAALKANGRNDAYAVWLTGGGPDRLLGFAPPVGDDGALGVSGPGRAAERARLPQWLDAAKRVIITRESGRDRPRSPGEIALSGRLSDLQAARPEPAATP